MSEVRVCRVQKSNRTPIGRRVRRLRVYNRIFVHNVVAQTSFNEGKRCFITFRAKHGFLRFIRKPFFEPSLV